MATLRTTATLGLWACFHALIVTASCSGPTTAHTSSGIFGGHPAANGSDVIEYLGIPFAKPPLNELRFAPPQPLTSNETYEASEFGFSCPAIAGAPPSYPGLTPQAQDIMAAFALVKGRAPTQSEDCLTLNVWTRNTESFRDAKKPVIVFFHGGRFAVGTSDSPMYNGRHLAQNEDVVVVTSNYRMNIFGFPNIPGETANLGLRDQRLAVEWVRDNIASFGGDPDLITITGQSVGGSSVDYWSYSFTKDPIVKGIVPLSGNVLSYPLNPPEVAQDHWKQATEILSCSSATNVLDCMREADWKDILAASVKVPPAKGFTALRTPGQFVPIADEELVFAEYKNRTKAGSLAKIPTLYSYTQYEMGYYQVPALARGVEPTLKEIDDFMLNFFTCSVASLARARVEQGIPAWVIRYYGDWDNLRLHPNSGAYHGVDMHMYFGSSEDVTGLPSTEAQETTARLMQKALAAFARDPARGLTTEMSWPQYSDDEKSMILLAVDNDPEPRFIFPRIYNVVCPDIGTKA